MSQDYVRQKSKSCKKQSYEEMILQAYMVCMCLLYGKKMASDALDVCHREASMALCS